MINKFYNVIVPRIDKSGPSMLSYDIAEKMCADGYLVNYYYLSDGGSCENIPFKCNKIKKFSFMDFFRISGIIHSHAFRPDLINGLLSLRKKNITLTTIPSYFYRDVIFDHPRWKTFLAWTLWKIALRKINIRACISLRMTRYYTRLISNTVFITADNFRLERNKLMNERSVTERVEKWVMEQHINGRHVMVFAAGLRPRKNILNLIDEVNKHKELALLILGDGPQRDIVLSKLEKFRDDEQFLYCGMVESPRELFKLCDFLVLPSHAEGVPNVVLEASSVGKPSLLSKIGIHCDLEKKGLAVTFNHWTFSDFVEKVNLTVMLNNESSKKHIVNTWNTYYSGEATMKVYKTAIEEARQ